jgi:hypothetical protein
MTPVDAVAQALAGADGKLETYKAEEATGELIWGHYERYQAEAKSLIERVEARGFKLVPIK